MPQNSPQNPIETIRGKVVTVSTEKRWAMACYLPVFNIITCALASVVMVQSSLCRFHARHGLVLLAFTFFTIFIALLSQTLSLMLWGVALLLHISGAVLAYSGKMTKIPIVSQFALKIPEYYIFTLLTGKSPDEIPKK